MVLDGQLFDIFLFFLHFPKKIMTLGFGLHFLCSSYSFTSNEISGPTFVFLTFSILQSGQQMEPSISGV